VKSTRISKDDKVLVSIRVRPSEHGRHRRPPNRSSSCPNATAMPPPPPLLSILIILTGSDNKSVYDTVTHNHACAAMDGYNAVIFAYGQMASSKTFTLVCNRRVHVIVMYSDSFYSLVMTTQPGFIPCALMDVFAFIRHRRASTCCAACISRCTTGRFTTYLCSLPPLPCNFKQWREWAARRTASTDWNDRSSRSHSVFRVVIESRERGDTSGGRQTPAYPRGHQHRGDRGYNRSEGGACRRACSA
jgi:centromeric protein E